MAGFVPREPRSAEEQEIETLVVEAEVFAKYGLTDKAIERLRALVRRRPEILDIRLPAPIVVIGMFRAGTTFLSYLLENDPGNRALLRWETGDSVPPPVTTAELTETLYGELLAIARRLLRSERTDHTLETSALVHEAFLRLAMQHANQWQSQPYFLGAAATTMRRVLVDYARARQAGKRDAGIRTTLVSAAIGVDGSASDVLDVLALDDVLTRLVELDPRQARVVELRVFGGFDIEEIAGILGVSARTIKRDWRFAKAWLACQLSPAP